MVVTLGDNLGDNLVVTLVDNMVDNFVDNFGGQFQDNFLPFVLFNTIFFIVIVMFIFASRIPKFFVADLASRGFSSTPMELMGVGVFILLIQIRRLDHGGVWTSPNCHRLYDGRITPRKQKRKICKNRSQVLKVSFPPHVSALWAEGGSKQKGIRVHATHYEIDVSNYLLV